MFEEKRAEQISESLHETVVIPWIRVTLLRDVIPFFRSMLEITWIGEVIGI